MSATTRPRTVIPPYRFAIVEENVYRGAYPVERNFPFLQRSGQGGRRAKGLVRSMRTADTETRRLAELNRGQSKAAAPVRTTTHLPGSMCSSQSPS